MLWLIHGRSTLHRSYAAWSLEQNIIWYCFFKNWTLVRIECHSPSHCTWLASLCCSSPTLKCDLSFSCYRTAVQSVYKCNKVACVCVCVPQVKLKLFCMKNSSSDGLHCDCISRFHSQNALCVRHQTYFPPRKLGCRPRYTHLHTHTHTHSRVRQGQTNRGRDTGRMYIILRKQHTHTHLLVSCRAGDEDRSSNTGGHSFHSVQTHLSQNWSASFRSLLLCCIKTHTHTLFIDSEFA